MLNAALKAGWIQIGPGIPVFFKIDPPGENIMTYADGSNPVDYCVRFVVTCDARGYYDFYNMWIENGTIKPEDLNIERIFGTCYTSARCPLDRISEFAAITIGTHYFCKEVEKVKYYDTIAEFLSNERKSKLNATI
jgi:hypothetical protein